jgi:hypothetical protein
MPSLQRVIRTRDVVFMKGAARFSKDTQYGERTRTEEVVEVIELEEPSDYI